MNITCIIPVHNSEEHLARCLDSILVQSFSDYEIIIVDDASLDRSRDIAQAYAGRYPDKVRLLASPVCRGPGGARNLGLAAARGEYVVFVDSDDYIDSTMFEALHGEAVRSGADIVVSDYLRDLGPARPLERVRPWKEDLLGRGTHEVRSMRVALGMRVLWAQLIRRSLFVNYGVRFAEDLAGSDQISSLLWCVADLVIRVDEALYVYRVDNASITRARNSERILGEQQVLESTIEQFRSQGLDQDYSEALDSLIAWAYYIHPVMKICFMFDRPDWRRLVEMRRYMRTNHPNYRKNRYYTQLASRKIRMIARVNDFSPRLLGMTSAALSAYAPWALPEKFRPDRSWSASGMTP